MRREERKVFQYSTSFKHQIVNEFESGASISELNRRYGIGGAHTIEKWVKKFGKAHLLSKVIRVETMEDRDKLKQQEEEIKALKIALADTLLANKCLETVIDEANKEYKTDLKKSFGTDASKRKTKK